MGPVIVLALLGAAYYAFRQVQNSNINIGGGSVYTTTTGITNDPSTWPSAQNPSDPIWQICAAIAMAEGYQNGPGYVPFDLNNPGDISDGAATYGSQAHSGSSVTTFPDAETGWQWLHDKVQNAASGSSAVYMPTMTWNEIAQKWAGDWQNWVTNVTQALGVDPNSTLGDYAGGGN